MRRLTKTTLLLLLLSMLPAVMHAQAARALPPPPESLHLGPGDQITVKILREPELTSVVRVLDSGEVALPLVGTVDVNGMSILAVERAIAKAYEHGDFLVAPQVSVSINQMATQTVAVLGQVSHPGTVTLHTTRTLLDVLAMAGGFTPEASRHVIIERGGEWGEQIHVFLPNDPQEELAADVNVEPGDRILVPKAGIVYVLGDVNRPGGYLMQDNSHLSTLQAIALAQGTKREAKSKDVYLLRKTATGYTTIRVQLRDMERGKIPDLPLQADDILYVPFSVGRFLLLGSTNILAAASAAAIYAHP